MSYCAFAACVLSRVSGPGNHGHPTHFVRISVPQHVPVSSDAAHPQLSISPTGFAALGVPAVIVAALAARGIEEPFPIQSATLPDSLQGRDVLGRGRTGSGKTVAFVAPTLARLATSKARRAPKSPRALILVPTRELAAQVLAVLDPLAKSMRQSTVAVFGGVGQGPQVRALRNGVDVCVATPGRLEDLIRQGHCRLSAVEVTVLDEADHMADLGFLPAVRRILDQTPSDGQRMLFSATLDSGVDTLVRAYLHDPVTHSVDSADSPIPQLTHHLVSVSHDDKSDVVRHLVSGPGRTLAFTRTKHGAQRLAKQLTAAGVPAVDLHGNLSQGARQRNLAAFHAGQVRVLVATDIAARGIHVDDLGLVVHVDPPAEAKAYLHRSGRTGRAGSDGVVVTVGTPEQNGDLRTLMRQASITPTMHRVRAGDTVIADLAAGTPVETGNGDWDVPNRNTSGSARRRTNGASLGGQRPRSGAQRSVAESGGWNTPQAGRSTRSGAARSVQGRGAEDFSSQGRPSSGRSSQGRPAAGRPSSDRPGPGRPGQGASAQSGGRPGWSGKPTGGQRNGAAGSGQATDGQRRRATRRQAPAAS